MAHPKRKTSKQRRDKRRTHYKAASVTLSSCSNCEAVIRYHHICGECGYYRGKPAIEKAVAV